MTQAASTLSVTYRRRGSGLRRSEAIWGWVWISPWLVGFVVFSLGPMIASLYLSFTSYDLISSPTWIGWQNYQTALTGNDRLFWPSLGRTVTFVAIVVPLGVAGSLAMALLLNQQFRGIALFRTLFYLPSLTPAVAAAIWRTQLRIEPRRRRRSALDGLS